MSVCVCDYELFCKVHGSNYKHYLNDVRLRWSCSARRPGYHSLPWLDTSSCREIHQRSMLSNVFRKKAKDPRIIALLLDLFGA